MKWLNILLILFFLFCKTYSTKPTEYKTQDYNQALEYLQGWILKTMEDYKVVGLSLVVVDDKQVQWKFQAGYENKEKKISVRDNTNFNIGSIAKVINTVAILKLVEEKKLNLNDPIHKYVDDLPIDYDYHRPITIKQLLTHHSGLPSDLMKFLWNEDYLELEQITKEIRLIYLANPPGEVFSYSNLGVTLSGRIIEVLSGKKYSDYLQEMFRELEMNQTSTNLFRAKNVSNGYDVDLFGTKSIHEPPIVMVPAGGIYTNAEDMAKFMQMILNRGRIKDKTYLSQNSVSEMFRLQELPPFDDQLKMGLPFFLNDLGFGKVLQANHGGATLTYHSIMILLPELPMGILFMTNTTTGRFISSQVAVETLSFFANHKFSIKRDRPSRIALNNAIYNKKEISGYYNTTFGMLQILDDDFESIKCSYLDFSCEFIPNNGLFRFYLRILKFIPVEIMKDTDFVFKKINDQILLYSVMGNSTMLMGSKISFSEIEQAKKMIGEYVYPVEKNQKPFFYIEKIAVEEKDHKLILKIFYPNNPMPLIFYVIPYGKDKLKIPGLGRQLGDVLVFKNDEVYYSGFVFKKSK